MTNGHAHYADWDAAYVLGSLSPAERRQFESHLEGCERCRGSVAELSGLPGLLARLDGDRAFELIEHRDEDQSDESAESAPIAPLPADLVARIQAREAARRSGRRTRLLLGLAAAAVVAAGIVIPVSIVSAPHPTVTTALSPVVSSALTARVDLTSKRWGTELDMTCRYRDIESGAPSSTRFDYALWVVQKDGSESELSSWSVANDSTVRLSAGTSAPVGDIAAVQVRSLRDGTVLLESDLRS